MVCIQCFLFTFFHSRRIDTVKVNGHIGQILKVHELTISVLLTLPAEQLIFCTDAMASFYINTGFICRHHSLFKLPVIITAGKLLIPEAVWSFMDIQKITYPVTGSVFIIQSLLPENLPGCQIQIGAPAALRL